MGSQQALKAFKAYRDLLKAVKRHIGKEEYKKHLSEYITEQFRKNSQLSDPSLVVQRIQLANDYAYLLNSVHHHKELLFSYNIAVDRSDEMKRVLGKSAASVGLKQLSFPRFISLDNWKPFGLSYPRCSAWCVVLRT
ncbi:hypothetical protein V6N13_067408 [Hibiscus sabdariffa]|uniref:Complex 1 LYR protein n=1 Tax=Hibiscus sabdariffa TaxID=183260 RepID=A0ABR2DUW6_9ROSI